MEYRKACLELVNQLLRENIEGRFLVNATMTNNAVDDTLIDGWSAKKTTVYRAFMKERSAKIAREVYTESIEETMEAIMLDMADISSVFTDDEMRQIYELTKSPLGLKIIRNLDIMREAVRDGLMLMASELTEKWNSPVNVAELDNFLSELNQMR